MYSKVVIKLFQKSVIFSKINCYSVLDLRAKRTHRLTMTTTLFVLFCVTIGLNSFTYKGVVQ